MPTTDTSVGRLVTQHPDLGHDGGASLHTKVRNAWTKWGDNINGRFFIQEALADAANVDFDHNFKVALDELHFVLYSYNTGTGLSTRIVSGGSPDLDDFTIVATPGNETTQIRVTNNTGGNQDISLLVVHGAPKLADIFDVDLSVSPTDGQSLIYESSSDTWKAGNPAAAASLLRIDTDETTGFITPAGKTDFYDNVKPAASESVAPLGTIAIGRELDISAAGATFDISAAGAGFYFFGNGIT